MNLDNISRWMRWAVYIGLGLILHVFLTWCTVSLVLQDVFRDRAAQVEQEMRQRLNP